MWLGVVSLFPQLFQEFTRYGVVGRALQAEKLEVFNPRSHATGNYRQVDDKPYGGGCGMLMQCEPLRGAIEEAQQRAQALGYRNTQTVFFSPQGRIFNHCLAAEYATKEAMILVSGCYEGIDERIVQSYADKQISIGDYVLSGGELPIMVFVNAIARFWDNTLGNDASAAHDSFGNGLLKGPQYTRPQEILDKKVPDLLLSGDHQKIARWHRRQALGRTWLHRPLLLETMSLSMDDKVLLMEFIDEQIGDS